MSPQDYLDPIATGTAFGSDAADGLDDLGNDASMLGTSVGDDIARFAPPLGAAMGTAAAMAMNPMSLLSPLFSSMGSMMQSIGSFFGGGSQQPGFSSGRSASQQFFGNAAASSTGDPHLAFSGTNAAGRESDARWDSMTSHADLLDSSSFAGGFNVSTNVTAPNANGVTYNQSASVTANGERITLDANGNATISDNRGSQSIADGQSFSIGNGETVSRANDGSLTIDDSNGRGGSIDTTLSENGRGVDVNVQASNVRVGGDLTGGAANTTQPGTSWTPPTNAHHPWQPKRRAPIFDNLQSLAPMD
ncbi:MAG TPA: hypothetical protein VIJ12_08310 [Candidatus Baltobacteraceae bacterium]